nr:WD40 repeat domain-containing protein [uncultured Desulfobulbus sp.]
MFKIYSMSLLFILTTLSTSILAGEGGNTNSIPSVLALLLDEDNEPPLPACAAIPPAEGPVSGIYRSYSYPVASSVMALAVSMRGWRTAAATEGDGLYIFQRGGFRPLVHALPETSLLDVAMSRDGSSVITCDNAGVVYFFACDASTPAWSYDTKQDDPSAPYGAMQVTMSGDGRWAAATSGYFLYIFRRDRVQPVLKQMLGSNALRLTSLAISQDGNRLAVATEFGSGANGTRSATLFFLDRYGVRWQKEVAAEELECTANEAFLPLDISADGSRLAAAGCDDQVRFWITTSATPQWITQVNDGQMLTSLALAEDGKSLAITGDTVHYLRSTAEQPDFTAGDNWALDYWLTYQQPSVYGVLDSWPSPWDGLIGRAPRGGLKNLGISDNGHYIFSGSTDVSYLLHRDYSDVVRLFGASQEVGQYFSAVAMAPDASWVAAGSTYGNEIVRFEVAPIQKVSTAMPLSFTFPAGIVEDIFDFFGLDKIKIDYVVLKPGRAAELEQDWALWGTNGGVPVSPFTGFLCKGESAWSWTVSLVDGDIEETGSREIELPQCLSSNVSGFGAYELVADLPPKNPESGAAANLSRDQVLLMSIQAGTGQ